MKIKFLVDRQVKDHEGKVIEDFKAGQVRELSENSARRWLARGVAEEVQGGKKSRRKADAGEAAADAPTSDDDSIMAERKVPRPAEPMTHEDHPAAKARKEG